MTTAMSESLTRELIEGKPQGTTSVRTLTKVYLPSCEPAFKCIEYYSHMGMLLLYSDFN